WGADGALLYVGENFLDRPIGVRVEHLLSPPPVLTLDGDEQLARRLRDVGARAGGRGDEDDLGRAVPLRARLAKLIEVADQDRGVHQGDRMRARAASQGGLLGGREGQVWGRRASGGGAMSGECGRFSRNASGRAMAIARFRQPSASGRLCPILRTCEDKLTRPILSTTRRDGPVS